MTAPEMVRPLALSAEGGESLPVSFKARTKRVASPFFQMDERGTLAAVRGVGETGRVTILPMDLKCVIKVVTLLDQESDDLSDFRTTFFDADNGEAVEHKRFDLPSMQGITTFEELTATLTDIVLDYANNTQSYGLTADDLIWVTASHIPESEMPLVKIFSGTVAGGAGDIVFDISSGGDAQFSEIEGVVVYTEDVSSDWLFGTRTVAGDLKSVTVNMKRQQFSGITVVGIPVLGSVAINNAPNGTAAKLIVMGKKA